MNSDLFRGSPSSNSFSSFAQNAKLNGSQARDKKLLREFQFPEGKAVIFWPVGTGDSTTLVLVPKKVVMQIDLRHLEKADDKEHPEWPIIDYLVANLPKRNGRPYLAVFVLTHPDKDHIQGFRELLKRVDIGELWHTPRIFRDQSDEEALCDDAKAFRKEAHRRRKAIADNPNNVKSGDRLRVIGHDDILLEPDYQQLPEDCKSRPASIVSKVDGMDLSAHFQAFIHAPFKEDQAKNKNNTSLSLNVVLFEGQSYAQFMFFGDREYPTIKQIFTKTEERQKYVAYLNWNVMLCSHHCSKAVMHWQDEDDADECFKKDIMEFFTKYSQNGYIVSSSLSDFTDAAGDNPPHKKARRQYERIVEAGRFLCTHEHPSEESPEPIVFALDAGGLKLVDKRRRSEGPAGLGAAVAQAQGGSQPPATQTTFGSAGEN
jgi:beta-lactamase superfamily II metal-dependent hydrolase